MWVYENSDDITGLKDKEVFVLRCIKCSFMQFAVGGKHLVPRETFPSNNHCSLIYEIENEI